MFLLPPTEAASVGSRFKGEMLNLKLFPRSVHMMKHAWAITFINMDYHDPNSVLRYIFSYNFPNHTILYHVMSQSRARYSQFSRSNSF